MCFILGEGPPIANRITMYCFGPPLSLCTGLLQKLSTYNGKFSRMRQSRNFHVAFLLGSQFSGPIFRKLWQASHYFLKRRTPHPSMRTHRHTRACALRQPCLDSWPTKPPGFRLTKLMRTTFFRQFSVFVAVLPHGEATKASWKGGGTA